MRRYLTILGIESLRLAFFILSALLLAFYCGALFLAFFGPFIMAYLYIRRM